MTHGHRTSDPRKTIGFLSPVSTFKGGAERSLFDMMANPSVNPILIVPEEGPVSQEASARGIPVHVVSYGTVSSIRRPLRLGSVVRALRDWLRAARALARLTRVHEIDVVHSNGLKAHAIAGLSMRLGGAPWVIHIRDMSLTRLERAIWRVLVHTSSHAIFVSRACWPGDTLPRNASVIYNSMQIPDIEVGEIERVAGEFVLGICGRIHWWKGHHVALSWLSAARRIGLNLRLVVRGEAAQEDLKYIEELRALAGELGISERLSFEGRKEGLAEVYGGLDVVVVPSQTPDPLPRSVMEAMSVGLPVIGYPAGGIVEMIDPGCNGWLADTPESFCTAISEIVALGTQGLAALKCRAVDTVRSRFGRERMFSELDEVYRQVVPTRVRRP